MNEEADKIIDNMKSRQPDEEIAGTPMQLSDEELKSSTDENSSDNGDSADILDSTEDAVASLKTQLEAKEKEAAENYDRFLRLAADYDNYRKRMQKEFSQHTKYAEGKIISDILVVIDNLERALKAFENISSGDMPDFAKNLHDGVDLTYKQFKSILTQHGISEVLSSGEKFDPSFHEAVGYVETEDVDDDIVISEIQKGYLLYDRLLRPALVRVSKKIVKSSEN